MASTDQPTNTRDEQRTPSRAREWALNIGAIVGLICIVAAALSMFLGIRPLVFQSGSMSPTINTGALAFAQTVPAQRLKVGDVVSVINPTGVRITHRVTGLEFEDDGEVSMIMRGDANAAQDPVPYLISEADRVLFHVNGLGYVVAWLSNPVSIFLGGMLAGGLAVIAFGRTRVSPQCGHISSDDSEGIGAPVREKKEARNG
ncbi:signal peptidase I [Dietzia sp. NPDC055343]